MHCFVFTEHVHSTHTHTQQDNNQTVQTEHSKGNQTAQTERSLCNPSTRGALSSDPGALERNRRALACNHGALDLIVRYLPGAPT